VKNRLDLVAIATLTLVALVLIGVLAVLQLPVPDVLPLVVTAGLGALGMSASPTNRPVYSPAEQAALDNARAYPESWSQVAGDIPKRLQGKRATK
jgi:hypothetical protein